MMNYVLLSPLYNSIFRYFSSKEEPGEEDFVDISILESWLAEALEGQAILRHSVRDEEALATGYSNPEDEGAVAEHHLLSVVVPWGIFRAKVNSSERMINVVDNSDPPEVCFSFYAGGVCLLEVSGCLFSSGRGPFCGIAPLDLDEHLLELSSLIAEEFINRFDRILGLHSQNYEVWKLVKCSSTRHKWTARALVVDRRSTFSHNMKEWIRPGFTEESSLAKFVWALRVGQKDYCAVWMRYILVMSRDSTRVSKVLLGIKLAQVYYATLDEIDISLSSLLESVVHGTSQGDQAALAIKDNVLHAELSETYFLRIMKYLNRVSLQSMTGCLEAWSYRELLLVPIRSKSRTAIAYLDDLNSAKSHKSSIYADVVLLGIAVVSVLSVGIDFAQFNRTSQADPDYSTFDLSQNSFSDMWALLSSDQILLISGSSALLFVCLFVMFRLR